MKRIATADTRTKLTNKQVLDARKRWMHRESGASLARFFSVSVGTISRAVNGKPPYDKIK